MAIPADREQVQQLMSDGARLVEVLPRAEYDDEHLPGAISIPLKELDRERVHELERSTPVIVYCYDNECDMSPRAAAPLESLGFERVYAASTTAFERCASASTRAARTPASSSTSGASSSAGSGGAQSAAEKTSRRRRR
jgi:rhodanese-related sulfurtransferase